MTDKEIIAAQKTQIDDLYIALDDRIQKIKRLEVEINRLQDHNLRMARKHYDDGVREVVERMKELSAWHSCEECNFEYVYVDDIDYLVKEMTEETDNV